MRNFPFPFSKIFLLGIIGIIPCPLLAQDGLEAEKKPVLESIDDFIAIQDRVQKVLENSKLATVGILITNGQGGSGSGVIISEDGYVMTAGHVSGEVGTKLKIVLSDGEHLDGEALGSVLYADAGLAKINAGDRKFPFAKLGDAGAMNPGDWCFVLAHPGGIDEERGLVLRIGRVIRRQTNTIQTDCKLVGGDSGGPLFDLDGNVVGINSRISMQLAENFHVTVRTFKRYWESLKSGEVKANPTPASEIERKGYLGVAKIAHARGVKLTLVQRDSPAQRAGLRPGDVITAIDGEKVLGSYDFSKRIRTIQPGKTFRLTMERDSTISEIDVTMGDAPQS